MKDCPALQVNLQLPLPRQNESCRGNLTPYSVVFVCTFQAPSFTACHDGLDEISFHHLQSTCQKSRTARPKHVTYLWTFGRFSRLPNLRYSKITLQFGKWNKSARVTSYASISSGQQFCLVFRTKRTHVTSKVSLLAQYGLVSIELTFELRGEFLDALLVHRLTTARLDHLFPENDARDRIKLRILDARCLLELCVCLGLRRDQLWADPSVAT